MSAEAIDLMQQLIAILFTYHRNCLINSGRTVLKIMAIGADNMNASVVQ